MKRTIVKYIILTAQTPEKLASKVTETLSFPSWELHGYPMCWDVNLFAQAVVLVRIE